MKIDTYIHHCFSQRDKHAHLPDGQKTFAIIADAFKVDIYKARVQYFPKFIAEKRDWISSVSENLLSIKKRSLDDYLSDFL